MSSKNYGTGAPFSRGTRSTRSNKSNIPTSSYREIFGYLDKLIASFDTQDNLKNALKQNLTQYLSTCSYTINSCQALCEEVVVTKITNQLTKNHDNGKENEQLFFKIYEQILSSYNDSKKRCALLTFLYQLSNSKFDDSSSILKDPSPASGIGILVPHLDPIPYSEAILLKGNKRTKNLYGNNEATNLTSSHSNQSLGATNCDNKLVEAPKLLYSKTLGQGTSTMSFSSDLTSQSSESSLILDSQNTEIVQSLIYSFTGVQSKYLKKDVITGRFKLDPKVKTLNEVQAGILLRVSDIGFYHDKLQSFTDMKRGSCVSGLMGQGFISALKNELTRYYGMIALLQEQLNRQREKSSNALIFRTHNEVYANIKQQLTPLKVHVWSIEPALRLQWLVIITDACQELKGGALASKVHSFLNHGNPIVHNLAKNLLLAICGPLYRLLDNWLLSGEINDPKNEFFIECLNEVAQDRLWHDKYRVRESMLPNFISKDMANKILVIGKSINFLNELCGDKDPTKYKIELHNCIREHPEYIFSIVADTKLHEIIDNMYLHTSKRVLDVVVGSHKLLEHLQAMRRYLLLGQGDFISLLMSNLKDELDKPAKELYTYDLSSIMDNAIRSTNAQYEDPEILNHLDVRLVAPCDGDIGWDILSLKYTVTGPLATMLEPSMGIYQVLFKPLWRMKHMEFILTAKIWKDQKYRNRTFRSMKEDLNPILYTLHHITSEMNHFIHQIQYYMLFEVIECRWVEFQKRIEQAQALDDILIAHQDFLDKITVGAFLDSNSTELFRDLESVYESIMSLEIWQDKFFALCLKELDSREKFEQSKLLLEAKGEFSVNAEVQLQRNEEKRYFELTLATQKKNLSSIGSSYDKSVRCFLLTLNSSCETSLQLFGVRLDFNEYYKKRDQRLGKPFTFEHMRMSNIFYNSNNKSILASRY